VLADVGDELSVQWRPDDGLPADEVRLWFDRSQFDTTITDDRGHYEVKTSFLTTGSEALHVQRTNRVDLAGGTPGSSLASGYQVSNVLVLQ
jgi:hypothetical protein